MELDDRFLLPRLQLEITGTQSLCSLPGRFPPIAILRLSADHSTGVLVRRIGRTFSPPNSSPSERGTCPMKSQGEGSSTGTCVWGSRFFRDGTKRVSILPVIFRDDDLSKGRSSRPRANNRTVKSPARV